MEDLEFQVGLYNGHAVGYCPQTGHLAAVPLRKVANDMKRTGQIAEVGADLVEALDYADDRPAVAGKIAKKIKKSFKKVATVAKKVAKSTLGKVVMTAVSMAAGPMGGAALGALRSGIKTAKKAASKKKPSTPKAKAQQVAAKKTAPIAAKLAAKKITPKQATAQAKKAKIPPKQVQSAAIAIRVNAAAKKGNKNAISLVSTAKMIDKAESNPQPLSVAPEYDAPGSSPFSDPPPDGGGNDDFFGPPPEAVELPEPYSEEPYEEEPADDGGELAEELTADPDDLGNEGEGENYDEELEPAEELEG